MFNMKALGAGILAGTWIAGATAAAPTCNAVTLTNGIPAKAKLALRSFSYCGGTLSVSAYIANLDYDKIVTLYYTNGQNKSTALSAVDLGYNSSLTGNNSDWELWGASVPVYEDGITQLLNLTFEATDIGKVYTQSLTSNVPASGAAAPTDAAPPAPYASPTGFGDDITTWLAASLSSQSGIALTRMFLNINPTVDNAAPGTIVAAQSGPSWNNLPDYEYNWVRDSSLTQWVVQELYTAATNQTAKSQYENILMQYAGARVTEQNDPNLQTGLGEPKFFLNNSIFTGPWGRPQNDGAATSAVTLMTFANAYLAAGGDQSTVLQNIWNGPVKTDLLFVAANWSSPSFDLWEEEESDHFYTRLVQRRALEMGATFATSVGDSSTSSTLQSAGDALSQTLSQFWDPTRGILLYEYGPVLNGKSSFLDTAVILGVIHGYNNDGVYAYSNDQVLSTAVYLATSFIDVFPIANVTTDGNGNTLGVAVGRYPEDVYNGTGTSEGNPWFLCTAAFAEMFYRASAEFTTAGSIAATTTSAPFWDYFAPGADLAAGTTYDSSTAGFSGAISALNGWGDAFMRRIMYHAGTSGHLTEEYNRDSGFEQGAADLTWSYASVLTAAMARAAVIGDDSFTEDLANLGVANNS